MRLIVMILAALGAYWWLNKRETAGFEDRQENLPAGVRLIPDREMETDKFATASAAEVQAAIAASAATPAPPPEASVAAVKTAKPSVPAKPGKKGQRDDLTVLNGIGKVFAQRLNEAGVNTFADLAKLSPDRLREITQAKDWQKIDPQAWIDQAKRRAEYGE